MKEAKLPPPPTYATTNQRVSNGRIVAIDIFKFFAVLAVLNSHLNIAYAKFGFLATGGAIGDALFFFCSGFMLFRGQSIRFDNFMKRRIARIYPTVIIVAIVGALIFGRQQNVVDSIIFGGGWFVNSIMVYYAVLWSVKRWFMNGLLYVWVLYAIVVIAFYYLFFDNLDHVSLFGNNYFKCVFFFGCMLQGAQMGITSEKYSFNVWTLPKLFLCLVAFYSFHLLQHRYHIIIDFQYLSLIPLFGIMYYTYCFCRAGFWEKIYNHKYAGQAIFMIGGICLECYLIQGFFITDKYNYLFPLNIPMIMVFILMMSYITNYFSSVLGATFKSEEYNWRKYLLRKQ